MQHLDPTPAGATRRRLLSIGALAAGALLLSACAADPTPTEPPAVEPAAVNEELRALLPQEIIDAGELIIGSPLSSPPLIFVDAAGDPTGIAYEVSLGLGEILGVDVVWEDLAFPGVIPGLQAGNIDLSMGVIGDTAARQEVLDFVDLFKNEAALLTQKGNPNDITDLESACGLTIGVLAGSLQMARVEAASDECTAAGDDPIVINEYQSQTDGQAAVQSERVAAYFAPFLTLNHVAVTAGNGEIFELGSGRYPDNPFGIGMQKDRGTLAEAIQGALKELVRSGAYDAIMAEYQSSEAALTEDLVLINGAGTSAFPLD